MIELLDETKFEKSVELSLNDPNTNRVTLQVNKYNRFDISIVHNPRVLNNRWLRVTWYELPIKIDEKPKVMSEYSMRILEGLGNTRLEIPDQASGDRMFSGYIIDISKKKDSILIEITQK
jgi:hypothetical protein